ncbi:hypothetical protein WG907_04245 [Sphingobium sp. AN558]|uniref:hypothetical protein n=1 Tax=Sphingobium sp. AN558 TaxID=3133442 RepID=UPI0030BF4860
MAYAENTTVPAEKSMADIVAVIKKAGGTRVAQMDDTDALAVQFFLTERMLRFRVPVATADQMPTRDNGNNRYTDIPLSARQKKADAIRRQRARALLLVIKAKLESVESGVETFDEAFLPNIVMSDGSTIWERVCEPLALEYASGKTMPFLLEGPRS